jgi:thiamine-phosphate pyrophosphorylase
MLAEKLRFCLVTDLPSTDLTEYYKFLQQCILGGITCVQLRAKTLPRDQVYTIAQKLKQFLTAWNIPLILNDYIDLAIEIDADGVHIGQTDGDPEQIRKLIGNNKYLGLSVESMHDVKKANLLNCIDYIAASAIFATKNKTNCMMYWGLEGLHQVAQQSKHPVVAIGGINELNASDVLAHGAEGIAVIGALHDSSNPQLSAKNISKLFK